METPMVQGLKPLADGNTEARSAVRRVGCARPFRPTSRKTDIFAIYGCHHAHAATWPRGFVTRALNLTPESRKRRSVAFPNFFPH